MNQKTIEKKISFSGRSLQGGKASEVTCRPSSPGSGIIFKRTDIEEEFSVKMDGSTFPGEVLRRTAIGDPACLQAGGAVQIQTVEHFLAALWALEIDNILVEVKGEELPAMDGSAKGFLDRLKEAGLKEQELPRDLIKILETDRIEAGDSSISLFPDEGFSISYLIDYDVPSIGRKVFDIELDGTSFEKEIASARTFCLKKEAGALLAAGLGQGADLENTLVMDDDGPVGATLRFPDEPARHKVLDLVGDLYMLGRPIQGRVVAEKSGHSLNAKLVKLIYNKYVRQGEHDER